jgi:hypothetical protein
MSKISKDGHEQIKVIRSALDSMFDKLNGDFYVKNNGKIKDIEKQYSKSNVFEHVKTEFEAIAGIVEQSGTWEEA